MGQPISASGPTTRGKWIALMAALLGWMFDGMEMGLFPLVANPTLTELVGGTKEERADWFATIMAVFLIGAAAGGVLFGWLGDRLGRVRAMSLSIVTYAIFSGLCGFATQAWHLAVLRFIASLGMGGEWSLGVALIMEVWPNQSRAWLAGFIGFAANCGYMLIAAVSLSLQSILGEAGWRLLMFCGAVPALLTVLIQLYVPESQRWQQEKSRGATSHWRSIDLLGVLIGTVSALGLIALQIPQVVEKVPWTLRLAGSVVALTLLILGFLYPILAYLGRLKRSGALDTTHQDGDSSIVRRMLLAAGISAVPLLGTWGTIQIAPTWVDQLTGGQMPQAKAYTQLIAGFGAALGCILAALAGERFGRRVTYAAMCLGSIASVYALYQFNTSYGAGLLCCAFLTGGITAAFYGWIPLYLPELFRTKVRATGQGFGFNFGRILAAIGVMQLPVITRELKVGYDVACPLISLIYLVGFVLIWFAPETKGKPLPE
jgi:MFS family permease